MSNIKEAILRTVESYPGINGVKLIMLDERITSFVDSVEEIRRKEFEILIKIINDIGVELRLLVSLAEQMDSDKVESSKILEVISRYEDETSGLIRRIAIQLRGK